MSDWLDELFSQLRSLPPARQAVLAATTLGSLAFFGWLVSGATSEEYRALYRGLPESETARVADALAAERIDYEISDGGSAILVPASEVAEARIRMAGRGLPGSGNTGFELFDAPAFGVTNYVHRVNYVRAVQGELARSIEQLAPVDRARVQVVIPERSKMVDRGKRKPSASAVLKLHPGRELEAGQVRAVVHLIASGLEGLDPSKVTVVDDAGRLLAPLDDGGPGAVTTAGVTSMKARIESDLSERIETILEKTVGPGNVVARVSASLDWSEVERTEEVYDPDSQVARSEHTSAEQTRDEAVGGVPGVVANLPDVSAGASEESQVQSSHETETINYEISKSVSRTVVPMGRVERLSIAVLVADQNPAPGEAQEATEASRPWSPEDLSLFEALARDAAGFDEKRGDRITVRSAPFLKPDLSVPFEAPSAWPQWSPLIQVAIRGAVAMLALVVFALLVVRPLARSVGTASTGLEDRQLPARLSEVESELGLAGQEGTAALAAGPRTEDGTRALRNWLNQG